MNDTFVCLQNSKEIIGQRRAYALGDTCKLTYNGQPCDVHDLMPGDKIEVDGQPAVKIVATGPKRAIAAKEVPHAPAAGDDGPAADSAPVE